MLTHVQLAVIKVGRLLACLGLLLFYPLALKRSFTFSSQRSQKSLIYDYKVHPQLQQNVDSNVEEEDPDHEVAEVIDRKDIISTCGKRQQAGKDQENGAFIKDLERVFLGLGKGPDSDQVAKLEKTHQDLCHDLNADKRACVNYGQRIKQASENEIYCVKSCMEISWIQIGIYRAVTHFEGF